MCVVLNVLVVLGSEFTKEQNAHHIKAGIEPEGLQIIVLPLQCIQASINADLCEQTEHNRLHPITHILESLDALSTGNLGNAELGKFHLQVIQLLQQLLLFLSTQVSGLDLCLQTHRI